MAGGRSAGAHPSTVAPDQLNEHRNVARACDEGPCLHGFGSRAIQKGWTRIYISLSTAPLRDRSGTIFGLMGLWPKSQRKHAEAELNHSNDQLRALAKRLESVRECESSRIAREIHDELGQSLTSVKFDLAWVSRHLASSDSEDTRAEMHGKLHALMQAVETIIQSVREIATTLRPRVLDELGLSAAIDWQTRDFEKRTGIRCQCSLPTEPIPVGPDQATTLFRIFQEI